jgi:hypothetical protein
LPRNALLDQATAQVGIHDTLFRAVDRFTQTLVRDPFTPRKPRNPLGLESPHEGYSNTMNYST